MTKKLFLALLSVIIFSLPSITFAQDTYDPPPPPIPSRISGGVVNGTAKELPKPIYPAAAAAANISGSVNVAIIIGKDGNVLSASAVNGHTLLREAAVEAARLAKFSPTLLSGYPVEVSGVLVYNFQPPSQKNDTLTDSEKDSTPFSFSLLLGMYHQLRSTPDFIEIIDEMFTELSKTDPSLRFSGKFSQKSSSEQEILVKKVKNIIATDNETETNWQFQTGNEVGVLLGQMYSQLLEKDETMSETNLKLGLTEINTLMKTAPEGIPQPVLAKLKICGNYSTRNDLQLMKSQREVLATLLELFELISAN